MKIFKTLTAVTALLITFGVAESAIAAVGTIYGPVYLNRGLSRGNSSSHRGGVSTFSTGTSSDLDGTVLNFTAPVPGVDKGELVIINGGDSGEKSRISSATVTLNDDTIAGPNDFSKDVDTITRTVDLLAGEDANELRVNIKSCMGCELAIYVMGELVYGGGGKPSGR